MQSRNSYRLGTRAVDEVLELDLDEGPSPLRRTYRSYERIEQ
jgi:hypothetical protein